MFTQGKSERCGAMQGAAYTIAQALIWGGAIIAVAWEVRGTEAAGDVTLWLSTGAFSSLMLSSGPWLFRSRKDDCVR